MAGGSVTPQNPPLLRNTPMQPETKPSRSVSSFGFPTPLPRSRLRTRGPTTPITLYKQPHRHPLPLTTTVLHGRPETEPCRFGFGFLAPNLFPLLAFVNAPPFEQPHHHPPLSFDTADPEPSPCARVWDFDPKPPSPRLRFQTRERMHKHCPFHS